jgi:hypothetical protein
MHRFAVKRLFSVDAECCEHRLFLSFCTKTQLQLGSAFTDDESCWWSYFVCGKILVLPLFLINDRSAFIRIYALKTLEI